MAKRYTDTDKYKKPFIRSLPAAYKLLWDYIYHDCDHAGIWHVDMEVAAVRIGLPVNEQEALSLFNSGEERIFAMKGGKWFVLPFITFQYGKTLRLKDRVHRSVHKIIENNGLMDVLERADVIVEMAEEGASKPLASPSLGAKVKDKVKVKDKDKDKDKIIITEKPVFDAFSEFWKSYPRRDGKGRAIKAWGKIKPDAVLFGKIMEGLERAKKCPQWTKEGGQYIPLPASWLNDQGWESEYKTGVHSTQGGRAVELEQRNALNMAEAARRIIEKEKNGSKGQP